MDRLIRALDRHGLQVLNTYELVVLVAALARLRHTPSEAWLSRFFRLSEPRLRDCGTGNLATLMRAVSKLNMASWDIKQAAGFTDWMQSMETLTLRRMASFRGDEMVRLITALADLRHRPQGE